MIFDRINNIGNYLNLSVYIERINSIISLIEDGTFNFNKPPVFDDGFKIIFISKLVENDKAQYSLERHKSNIDFHYVIEGIDEIGIREIEKCTNMSKPYTIDGDYELYYDEPEYRFRLQPGDFLLITPANAHDTMLIKGFVKKIVFKIPVS